MRQRTTEWKNGDKFVRLSSENAAPSDGALFVSGGSTDLPHRTLLPAPKHTLGHWTALWRFSAEIMGSLVYLVVNAYTSEKRACR